MTPKYKYITLAAFYLQQDKLLEEHECFWQDPTTGDLMPIVRVHLSPSPRGSFSVSLKIDNQAVMRWPRDNSVVALKIAEVDTALFQDGWLVEVRERGYEYKTNHIVISKNKSWAEIHNIANRWLLERTYIRGIAESNTVTINWVSEMHAEILVNDEIEWRIYLASTPIFI